MIGKQLIVAGEIVRAKFDMERIKATVKTAAELDHAKLTYKANITHCHCLRAEAYFAIIEEGPDGYVFGASVYFHPNFRVDGWDDFKALHYSMRLDYLRGMPDQSFPEFPMKPSFWEGSTYGSEVFSWPPRLFWPWMEEVKKGKVFELDPALPDDFVGSKSDPVLPPVRFAVVWKRSPQAAADDGRPSASNDVAGPSSGPRFDSVYGNQHPPPDDDVENGLLPEKECSSDDFGDGGIPDEVLAAMVLDD